MYINLEDNTTFVIITNTQAKPIRLIYVRYTNVYIIYSSFKNFFFFFYQETKLICYLNEFVNVRRNNSHMVTFFNFPRRLLKFNNLNESHL